MRREYCSLTGHIGFAGDQFKKQSLWKNTLPILKVPSINT